MEFGILPARDQSTVIGAAPPPPGVTPNFTNPEYNGRSVVAANIASLALATCVCGLRIFTKTYILHTVDYSDYLIDLAWDVPLDKFSPTFLQLQMATQAIYCVSMMFAKPSLLALYLRISPYLRFRWAVVILIAIGSGYSSAAVLVSIFQCQLVAKAWDVTITNSSCIDRVACFFAMLVLNVTTDLAMLVLPIPMLWNTKMPKRQRVGLIGIFMTGSLVCVVGFLRIKSLIDLIGLYNLTWNLVDGYVWVAIEMNTGIICACLPFGKAFLKHLFPGVLGRSVGYSYASGQPRTKSHPTTVQQRDVELSDSVRMNEFPVTRTHENKGGNGDIRSESQELIIDGRPDGASVKTGVSLPGPNEREVEAAGTWA
ncbi:hypothetical protein C8A03DRAFT_48350 [Achaetomium macrosporum]|uniref:Rhodopsin domain-containing protein n=1 Tax=Achaetomium macrosporum TaxID=79813 RepID=A0AAN7C094_9PEZI|nr:hypothetical protein C8A03DRAFT_48350 [Achaetomium macrosporum]